MKKLVTYLVGALALAIVLTSTIAALIYAVSNGMATLSNLATSTLSGVGMAIGGLIGSALILRFKTARNYVRSVLNDVKPISFPDIIQELEIRKMKSDTCPDYKRNESTK